MVVKIPHTHTHTNYHMFSGIRVKSYTDTHTTNWQMFSGILGSKVTYTHTNWQMFSGIGVKSSTPKLHTHTHTLVDRRLKTNWQMFSDNKVKIVVRQLRVVEQLTIYPTR